MTTYPIFEIDGEGEDVSLKGRGRLIAMVCVENYSAADGYGMGGYDREVIYLFVLIVRIVPLSQFHVRA